MTTTQDFTLKAALIDHMYQSGLFEQEANQVFEEYSNQPSVQERRIKWDDLVSEYPPQLLNVMIVAINASAYKWLEKNKPNHWAKDMFKPA